ncbi:MAG: colanic acid biosynthesis glycosyltransferase WcaL [Chloroflexi bacterium]|nr:MAG: colanic acid biosynthesis glycosyltransferase WcaL [Chloroflexota bacterium]
MSRFPHLPETFILREMNALEELGWQVALYPLVRQEQAVIHAEAQPWLPRVNHIPFMSSAVVGVNARTLRQSPGAYGRLWQQVVRENASSAKFLVRAAALFPKAVAAAEQMVQEGVEHIHAHYATHPALVAWLIHKLTGISYSVTVHAHDIFVRQEMLATKLRDAAFVAAISEYNRAFLSRTVGPWVRAKTHVVHCGIVPELYAPVQHNANPKKQLEIITIGSLQPYKGQSHLIEACALLRDLGIPFRCRIIGGGEERSRLEQTIREMELGQQVELLGPQPQDEVARMLPQADCYVQPSVVTPSGKMEGIPVALMEALACQLPVVATAISGIPELVRPGETGYLVPPADAAALAGALSNVYAHPADAHRLAVAGRQRVLREFSLRPNVEQLAQLFEATIQSQPAGPLPVAV